MASDVQALRVVELRRAGIAFDQIADRLSLIDEDEARALYAQVIDSGDMRFSADLEAARLERLHTAAWPAASKGDLAAIDRVVKIGERREKLLGPPAVNDHAFLDAFDASVAASTAVKPVDQALVEAGRKIANRVDAAAALGEGQEVTKALYLVPHMVNILRELLATPASRTAAGLEDREKTGGKLAQLRSVKFDSA